MQTKTARGAFAALAVAAALAGGSGAAEAAPLALEPAAADPAPVGELYAPMGSSSISASVNAKLACLVMLGRLDC
jgi:hypothetical protein